VGGRWGRGGGAGKVENGGEGTRDVRDRGGVFLKFYFYCHENLSDYFFLGIIWRTDMRC